MTLKERLKQRSLLMRIGLVFLVLAQLAHRFLLRGTGMDEELSDLLFGFLMGISIGCLLASVLARARRNFSGGPPTTGS